VNVFLGRMNGERIGFSVLGIFVIDKNTILTVNCLYLSLLERSFYICVYTLNDNPHIHVGYVSVCETIKKVVTFLYIFCGVSLYTLQYHLVLN